ncbi:MAG: ROK family protein [Desulfosoma sp.]
MFNRVYCIGVDVGGTFIKMGLFDEKGDQHRFERLPSNASGPPEALLQNLAQACRNLMIAAQKAQGRVLAVGLGVAGKLDTKEGTVVFSPNLPNMQGFPLAPRLQQALEIPVFMENDANVFGLGERWAGQGRDVSNWIGVTLGTGVGGCLVADGSLWLGDQLGFVGEIGHMIIDPDGPLCACGQTGCLEAHASGSALVRDMTEALRHGTPMPTSIEQAILEKSLTAEHVFYAAQAGNPQARDLFRRMGWALGLALGNLFTFLGIQTAILGGGVSQAWPLFFPSLMETLHTRYRMLDATKIKVYRSTLGAQAPLYGAAHLAWKALRGDSKTPSSKSP